MEQSQTSRFITYFRDRLKTNTEQPATEAQARLEPGDGALIEQFMELAGKAEKGRAEREADQQYQAELEAALRLLRGSRPSGVGAITTH